MEGGEVALSTMSTLTDKGDDCGTGRGRRGHREARREAGGGKERRLFFLLSSCSTA